MRLWTMVAAVLLAVPLSAQAQDITQDMAAIGTGSYVVFSDGNRSLTHVYRGPTGGLWVVDIVDGADPNATPVSREFRDARGQTVRIEFANGNRMTFVPNNCQRTIGACIFNQTNADGSITMQGVVTTATADGYSFEHSIFDGRGDPVPAMNGRMTLDPMGGFLVGTITTQDGAVTTMRQVQAVYR